MTEIPGCIPIEFVGILDSAGEIEGRGFLREGHVEVVGRG